jgi:hypothetical protein
MDLMTLTMLGAVLGALLIGGFLGLFGLAAFVYVWTHIYPWLKSVGKLAAKPENFFPLAIIAVLLIVVILIGALFLHFTLLLLLLVIPLVMFIPLDLGIIVWLVRLVQWLFIKWRGLLVGLYVSSRLEVIKFKIKVDMQKETDWKVKWSETKNKLSEEAEQARRKISKRGK